MSKSKNKAARKAAAEAAALIDEKLDDLLARLRIENADYAIFSDGSGADFSRGCGYASVVIDFEANTRELLFGALNRGTVNIAEMLAVLQGLDYLVNLEAGKRQGVAGRRLIRHVHVVTDSKYCQETGSSGRGRTASRNVGVWSLFESYARQGLIMHWHHIRRDTCGLNRLCDAASKLARLRMRDYNIEQDLLHKDVAFVLDKVNPGD